MATPLGLGVLLALAAAGEPRLLEDQAGASVGLLGNGYGSSAGTVSGDTQLTVSLGYRAVWSGFVADAALLAAVPLVPDGTVLALTGALRVGYTGQRWSVQAGVLAQWAQEGTAPVSVLPTLHAAVDLGPVALSAGVLDLLGLVPAHLSVEASTGGVAFSVGWVAPVGLLSTLELPAWTGARVRLTACAYRLFGADLAFVSVGFVQGGVR